jgi:hypothetical protein
VTPVARRSRIRHLPIDIVGRDVRVGDWVRVVRVPESITGMDRDAKWAFARAVGRTFQIEAFDELGCAELELPPAVWRGTRFGLSPFACDAFVGPRDTAADSERFWSFVGNLIGHAGPLAMSLSTTRAQILIGWLCTSKKATGSVRAGVSSTN